MHGQDRRRNGPVRSKLELPEGVWSEIPAWPSRHRWLEAIPRAYERHYATRVAPAMPGNPVSLKAILAVAEARAEFADGDTGRNCRPTIETLTKVTGYSDRTVQRADQALLLMGMATEVMQGPPSRSTSAWRATDPRIRAVAGHLSGHCI